MVISCNPKAQTAVRRGQNVSVGNTLQSPVA